MPFPIALRRALTALVGAVFAILCMGVGAAAAPTAKTGDSAPSDTARVHATGQQSTATQVRAVSATPQADDGLADFGNHPTGMATALRWHTPVFSTESTPAVAELQTPRAAPVAAGRAPPA